MWYDEKNIGYTLLKKVYKNKVKMLIVNNNQINAGYAMNFKREQLNGFQVFYFLLGESHPTCNYVAIYFHLDFEGYEGHYVGDMTDPDLVIKKMLPNEDIEYCFTINDLPYYSEIADN